MIYNLMLRLIRKISFRPAIGKKGVLGRSAFGNRWTPRLYQCSFCGSWLQIICLSVWSRSKEECKTIKTDKSGKEANYS